MQKKVTHAKQWTLRFRAVDIKNFEAIERGAKRVETRAATKKYREIKKGDALVVVCGRRTLTRTVKRVKIFRSLAALFKSIPFKTIMPYAATTADARAVYYGYPGYREKLKKCGVIAFWI